MASLYGAAFPVLPRLQSATPLYFHGNFGILKPDLSLILLHKPCRQFPLTLGFRARKVREQPEPVTRELACEKEIARRAVGAAPLEGFWNLPNQGCSSEPFPRLTYAEAMGQCGADRPDTRFAMELKDVTNIFSKTTFKVFADVLALGGL